ncbi:hypothetical protein [Mycobacterium sp.]|uniref:hypothetical protein n=1 Tax=Mycobacterium sp. TaxID=1785 RepID=UPI003F97A8B3
MAHDDIDAYEAALRQLPEAHSLALRLKRADAADEVVRGYLDREHRVSPQSHAEPK